MGNRLEACFDRLHVAGRAGLFPFVTAGDPDLDFTRELLPRMIEAGADGFEVGVPFSDPLADGPTIQRSSMRSLAGGTRLSGVLEMVGDVRADIPETPLILMTYYNPIVAMGLAAFVRGASQVGADAVIVPDLPPEEAGTLVEIMNDYPLEPAFMLAPTSTQERIALVNDAGGGFIYYVGQMGVTGAREALDSDLGATLARINRVKGRPVLVGFGIKTPEQAAEVAGQADGVIVGSALIDVMEAQASRGDKIRAACDYIASLRKGLDRSKTLS